MRLQALFNRTAAASLVMRAPWEERDAVWLDYGVQVRQLFVERVAQAFVRRGYSRMLLPTFVPQVLLHRQQQHGRDIERISFAIDEGAQLLKATSEVLFSRLVSEGSTHARFVQCTTVFRREDPERRETLLRAQEIDPFVETMTFTASAARTIARETSIYEGIFRDLCVPVTISERPQWDTFPEARKTVAFDSVIAGYGVSQVASVHDLGTSFGRAFQLKNRRGKLLQQTSTGISGRALLASIATHETDSGFVLPAAIAPVQVLATCSKSRARRLTSIDARLSFKVPGGIAVPVHLATAGTRVRGTLWNGVSDSTSAANAGEMIRQLLDESDNVLRSRAKRCRANAIEETPSCKDVTCLARHVSRRCDFAVLGFAQTRTQGQCPFCGARTSALLRLARTA